MVVEDEVTIIKSTDETPTEPEDEPEIEEEPRSRRKKRRGLFDYSKIETLVTSEQCMTDPLCRDSVPDILDIVGHNESVEIDLDRQRTEARSSSVKTWLSTIRSSYTFIFCTVVFIIAILIALQLSGALQSIIAALQDFNPLDLIPIGGGGDEEMLSLINIISHK